MPDEDLKSIANLYLKNLTLTYEIKTPDEEKNGDIICDDENAPYTLFPFNSKYRINLFFIDIGVKLGKDKELYKILYYLWKEIVKEEALKPEDIAFIDFSPEAGEQPREDIRFLKIEEILKSRFSIRKRIHKELYLHAIDGILGMLEQPDETVRMLELLTAEGDIGIVFLISSYLSKELLDHYPFPRKGQDDAHPKLHANIISIKVVENRRRNEDDSVERYLGSSLHRDKDDRFSSIDSESLVKKILDINGISKNGNGEYIKKEDVIQTISDHFSKINEPIRE